MIWKRRPYHNAFSRAQKVNKVYNNISITLIGVSKNEYKLKWSLHKYKHQQLMNDEHYENPIES